MSTPHLSMLTPSGFHDLLQSTWLIHSCLLLVCIGAVLCTTLFLRSGKFPLRFKSTRQTRFDYPPIIDISPEDMFNRPQEAYEAALRAHGPVIGVWRKGRLEYIVDQEHTKHVFSDDRAFSFEQGVATVLNLRFVLSVRGGTFFRDVDRMVANGLIPKMESITHKVYPVFLRQAKELLATAPQGQTVQGIDFFAHAHHSIAEAMLSVIMGEQYISDKHLAIIETLADDIAHLTGIYQNVSFFARTFPRLWIFCTWIKIICGTVIWRYFFVLGPHIWRELRHNTFKPLDKTGKDVNDDGPLLHHMGRMFVEKEGPVPIIEVLWISCLMLSLVFASVHQTAVVAVWVMYELAARPSYIPAIREELSAVLEPMPDGSTNLSYESLRNAVHLDSFIREVLRLKGDTLSTTRQTVQDVVMGQYVIPKGHLVIPLATLSHQSPEVHGQDAAVFEGFRWVDRNLPAAMVSLGYFPFGLNRWACPGRVLAVAEIKMIVMTFLGLAMPTLEGGKYRVVDPLNATSVAPEGNLLLDMLDVPLF